MSQELETTLRRSLEQVDRTRKGQIAGLAIFFLLFLVQASTVVATLHRNGATTELRVMLIANVELMVFTVGFCTLGICFFVTRMTKKILKAIELSSNP